jgi:hypothetical protein
MKSKNQITAVGRFQSMNHEPTADEIMVLLKARYWRQEAATRFASHPEAKVCLCPAVSFSSRSARPQNFESKQVVI